MTVAFGPTLDKNAATPEALLFVKGCTRKIADTVRAGTDVNMANLTRTSAADLVSCFLMLAAVEQQDWTNHMTDSIVLYDYDIEWPVKALTEIASISAVLPGYIIREIAHIGSTSVVGCGNFQSK